MMSTIFRGRVKLFNTIEEAVAELKNGKIIIVCDDEDRENEGDFVGLAEYATPQMVNFMISHGKGLLCCPINIEYANRLGLPLMVENNQDNFATAFTQSIDHISCTTGISAFERSITIKSLVDPSTTPKDLRRPGHVFPLIAKDGGVLKRPGHTEATIDLAKLAGAAPVGLICEIIDLDGTMAKLPKLFELAREFDLKIIHIRDLIDYRKIHEKLIQVNSKANLLLKPEDVTISSNPKHCIS